MRNLKRVLSLTLASVMLLGMMVVGSAAKGYDDVSDTDNVEAIEVLQAIEVMVGDDRGFGPERPVNRAEMAVVMGKLLSLDYNYYTASCPFTDVYDWAQGWVGACYANKIVSGRGDGIYDPGATVTAVEAASMLMRALGYFQYQNDYSDGFELATVTQGKKIGIFDNVGSSATEPMTRNQVAQMVLNALRSGVVEPDGNTINLTTPDGSVYTGRVNYVYVTSDKDYARAISTTQATSIGSTNDSTIVELGEQLYNGDLRLAEYDEDVFQRPARTWEYKGEQIGTYVKKELLRQSWTVKVTGKMLYELLTKNTIDTYNFEIAVDGIDVDSANANLLGSARFTTEDMIRTNTDAVGATGKGVLTEVYVDTNMRTPTVYIAVINTYLAKATDDYDEKDEELDLMVYNIEDRSSNTRAPIYVKDGGCDEPMTVSLEDFAIEDVKKDEIFLVNVAQGEVQVMSDPEVLSQVVINAFKIDDYVVTSSEQYDHASTARYDVDVLDQWDVSNLKDLTYNIYLDPYGYLIGLERNEDPDQYVFLTGIDAGASNLYATRADANIIHMDGTMATVQVDLTKSRNNLSGTDRLLVGNTKNLSQLNTWCKYSVSDDGVYTLKMIPTATTADVRPATNPKVAQFAQNVAIYDDSSTGGSTAGVKTISEKRVSLIAWDTDTRAGYNPVDGAGSTAGEVYVYGNDETVYINVTLDDVVVDDKSGGGANRRIVDEVDSVTVGVKNVNLEMANLPQRDPTTGFLNPEAEIYTLYNDKGVVIAAVTIGEDNGTSTNYAYITSGIQREEYGHKGTGKATEGKWTWYLNAIVDGEKTRLTETGDTIDVLDSLVQGEWYEIKYTSSGDVRKAIHIGDPAKAPFGDPGNAETDNYSGTSKYVRLTKNVETAINTGNNTVLLTDITTVDKLNFENGTLYTNNDKAKGFHVGENVKVVVVNANKTGTKEFDSVTDGFVGHSGLEKAIRAMNSRGTAPAGVPAIGDGSKWIELSAIMTNGFASVIVINDKSPVTSSANTGTVVPAGDLTVTVDPATLTVDARLLIGTNAEYSNTVWNALVKAGVRPISAVSWGGEANGKMVGTITDSEYRIWTIDATLYCKVTLDGTIVEYVQKTKNMTSIDLSTYTKGTGYIISDDNEATCTYKLYSVPVNETGLTNHVDIKTGYIKQTGTFPTDGSGHTYTITGYKEDKTAAKYMPYNGNITIKDVVTGGTLSDGDTVGVTIANSGTYSSVTSPFTVNATEATNGKTMTWTISKVTGDLGNVTVGITAAPDMHTLTSTGLSAGPVNGLTVTVVDAPEELEEGVATEVTVRVSGTATQSGTLTLGKDAADSVVWVGTGLLPGMSITTGVDNIINYTAGSYNGELTFLITTSTDCAPTIAIGAGRAVTGITLKSGPDTTEYKVGESFSGAGSEITVAYADGGSEDIAFANFGTKGVTIVGSVPTTYTATFVVKYKLSGQEADVNCTMAARDATISVTSTATIGTSAGAETTLSATIDNAGTIEGATCTGVGGTGSPDAGDIDVTLGADGTITVKAKNNGTLTAGATYTITVTGKAEDNSTAATSATATITVQ